MSSGLSASLLSKLAPLDTSPHLPVLLCDAPPGGDVLDLTAGASLSPAFAAAGHRVVAAGPRRSGVESVVGRGEEQLERHASILLDRCKRLPFRDTSFDLVAIDAASTWMMGCGQTPAYELLLQEARRLLRADGQMLVSARNRLRRNWWPGRRGELDTAYAPGPTSYISVLRGLGFKGFRLFGAQPKHGPLTLVAALETPAGVERLYTRSGTRSLESMFLRMLGASPLGPHLIARFLLIASPRDRFSSSLEKALRGHLRSETVTHWIAWSNPGQAVARVSAANDGFIVRIALDTDGAGRLGRNAETLEVLRSSTASTARDMIPRLVGRTVLLGREATIETLLPGNPIDTFPRHRVNAVVREQISSFLEHLREIGTLADARNAEWMRTWLDQIRPTLTAATSSAGVDRFCVYCLTSPELTRIRIGRVHGDFSSRNVLLDQRTGGVTGVIDWDSSAATAPTFVDPLHWEIRSRARDVDEYYRILRDRVTSLRKRPPDATQPGQPSNSPWWRESLWAHIVYGVWYNLNLARRLPEPRVSVAARLLDHVP